MICYKFKNSNKKYQCEVSIEQYENLSVLPMMECCRILNTEQGAVKII